MELVFHETEGFIGALRQLPEADRKKVTSAIDRLGQAIKREGLAQASVALNRVAKSTVSDLETSLFIMRAGRVFRVFLSLESDPLFDQTSVTLYDVLRRSDPRYERMLVHRIYGEQAVHNGDE